MALGRAFMAPGLNLVRISILSLAVHSSPVAAHSRCGRTVQQQETTMKTRNLLTASVLALTVGAPTAFANNSQVIDQIVADLSAQGFVRIEIDIERNGTFDVDAYGGGREGDFYFDAAGNLLSSDIDVNAAYGEAYTGGDPALVVELDDDYDDDDDYDERDDGDDDYDDDDYSNDDDDDDHDDHDDDDDDDHDDDGDDDGDDDDD
jgi:hypothetical protein